jgi:amidase
MPVGSISSSPDAVGVAVVNYQVPVCETHDEVLANCEKIADMIKGVKMGYPGLDLICFPEYSTQGFHPYKWKDFTIKAPIEESPEVKIFMQACVDNKVWGIFSLTGTEHEDPSKNPYNTLIMISDTGSLELVYHKICPWVPKEPWTAAHETKVAVGPKGLVVGGIICYDGDFPEIVRDTVFKGAELVVRIQGYMNPCNIQQVDIAKVRAFENNVYFAVANMAGRDKVYSYFGHSNIVNHDGKVLAECSSVPDMVQYATLSLTSIRDARANWTANNAIYNIMHRGYTSEPGGNASCCFDFYKNWVNEPSRAKAVSEALTRNADAVEDATNVTQAQPLPPPVLKGLLGAGAPPVAKKLNGYANGHANGHANGVGH